MEILIILLYITLFVFGVLSIILFFKLWGMTNKVSSIEKNLKKKHNYEFYILSGEKEKAYQLIKESLINKLIKLQTETNEDEKFIVLAQREISKYAKLIQRVGFSVPEHLSSAKAFIEYRKSICNL